jgi:prevent-host-death family protein
MKPPWNLDDASKNLSQLLSEAARSGPQIITHNGVETAVVLSIEDYMRLSRPRAGLVDLLRASPLVGEDLEVDRNPGPSRDISL